MTELYKNLLNIITLKSHPLIRLTSQPHSTSRVCPSAISTQLLFLLFYKNSSSILSDAPFTAEPSLVT